MVVLNKDGFGFGLGSMGMLMGGAAPGLVDLDLLTEKSRPVGTVLMCELVFSVKSNVRLSVTLS